MSADIKDIARKLARQFGEGMLDGLVEKEPTPPPEVRRPDVSQPPDKCVQAGPYSVSRGYMFDSERDALKDRRKERPGRPAQRLTQGDWDALAEVEVTRNMDFDAFVRQACLLPMVRGFDPDYEPAARLFLAKKREAFR